MSYVCWSCKKKPDYFLPPSFSKCQEQKCPVLPLDVIMRGMSQGTVMYKIKGPTKWYKRKYKVNIQSLRLSYHPSEKPFWRQKNTKIDLADIEEVRSGWKSDVFDRVDAGFRRKVQFRFHPRMKSLVKEDNCFSLIIGPSRKVLDLVAPNSHTRDAWVRGLNHLLVICKSSQKKMEYNRWLKEQVRNADINNNGSLNFNECLALLKQLNISMDTKTAKKLFDSANFKKNKIDGEDALDPEEFVRFYYSLTKRPDIEELMKKYSVSKTTILSVEELQHFLIKEQKDIHTYALRRETETNITLEECKRIIDKYEPENEDEKISGYMSLKGFQKMLLSVEHNIFNKKHRLIYQDMTHPLHHYYVASSHNTYLLGGQLIGSSSVEGYIQALLRGCRCLELDVWDGPDDEPIIFHGYTLTSRIFLKDVLAAIKDYAFRSSQYPVILSLENHCSSPYQIKMADHFVTILGDYLYKDPIGEDEVEFPSPEALARKIILKGKKLKAHHPDQIMLAFEPEDEEEQSEINQQQQYLQNALHQEKVEAQPSSASQLSHASQPLAAAAPHRLESKLSDLINYFTATKFQSFSDCENWNFCEMTSFHETTALKFAAENGIEFVNFNREHFSRIYPKGSRTDSSNYSPLPLWHVGCQLVALNYQTTDNFMFLNNAKFAQNGGCGYILKPRFLYDKEISYDPQSTSVPESSCEKHLLIKIISGQQLPKPNRAKEGEIVDPYVSIKVFGHPMDVQKKKTQYVSNNGFDPVWDTIFLICLHVPELAIIQFLVKDNAFGKNEILGQYALPFTSIAEGYRHIHLKDTRGDPLVPASLFVHIALGAQ